MCQVQGCTQQTLRGDYCYFHTKVQLGLIKSSMYEDEITETHLELFNKYRTLAINVAYRVFNLVENQGASYNISDLIQQSQTTLWETILCCHLEDIQFPTTYLQTICFNTLVSFVRHENYLQYVPITLVHGIDEDCECQTIQEVYTNAVLKKVLRFVKRCSKLEREIFYYHVYPTAYKPRSLRWLSKKLDIPLTTMHRVKAKLLRKFRKGVR